MRNLFVGLFLMLALFGVFTGATGAASPKPTVLPSPTTASLAEPDPALQDKPEAPRIDITQKSEESLGPLEKLLKSQSLGPTWPVNPVKYAIRGAVAAGVPANTIVLLLLLPIVAFIIAFSRNIVGIRGFGIFLPAALSVVFVATGPIIGIGLFLVIVLVSTAARMILRRLKIKLQYLPRMAFILWAAVLGVLGILFLAPIIKFQSLSNVSIFAVLVLVLLAEDFIRVQLGKSVKTAIGLTTETLILSLISYLFLTIGILQKFVLLNPEITILSVGILDLVLAKYSGLRLMEIYRFRKLINSK